MPFAECRVESPCLGQATKGHYHIQIVRPPLAFSGSAALFDGERMDAWRLVAMLREAAADYVTEHRRPGCFAGQRNGQDSVRTWRIGRERYRRIGCGASFQAVNRRLVSIDLDLPVHPLGDLNYLEIWRPGARMRHCRQQAHSHYANDPSHGSFLVPWFLRNKKQGSD